MDEDVLRIANMLDEILARVIQGYEDAGVPLPERRFWTTGTTAHDCEQLTVTFNQAYIGPVGDEANEPQRCSAPRTVQLDIEVVRCIPGYVGPRGKAPTPEQIQTASRNQVIDAMLLLDLACTLDTWDGDLGGPGLGVIATVDAGEATGGFQGTILHLTVAVP